MSIVCFNVSNGYQLEFESAFLSTKLHCDAAFFKKMETICAVAFPILIAGACISGCLIGPYFLLKIMLIWTANATSFYTLAILLNPDISGMNSADIPQMGKQFFEDGNYHISNERSWTYLQKIQSRYKKEFPGHVKTALDSMIPHDNRHLVQLISEYQNVSVNG